MIKERVWEPCEGFGRGLRTAWGGEKTWTESSWESGQVGWIKSPKLNREQAVTKSAQWRCVWIQLTTMSLSCLGKRAESRSADFSIVITKTPCYNLCFLSALRKAPTSLDICDCWLNIFVGGPAFLVIHLTMHKMMGCWKTDFFFLHEIFLFDGALGKNDQKLR